MDGSPRIFSLYKVWYTQGNQALTYLAECTLSYTFQAYFRHIKILSLECKSVNSVYLYLDRTTCIHSGVNA